MMMTKATEVTQQNVDQLIATNPEAIGNLSDDQLNALIDGGALPDGDKASEASPDLTGKDDAANKDAVVDEKADILTKDGKNYIPNKVLVAARETATQAEARAAAEAQARQEAEAKAAALEEQLEAMKQGNQEIDTTDFLSDDELAVLHEDMPIVAERIKAQQAKIIAQSTQLKKQSSDIAVTTETIVANDIQEAIDAVPLLATLQATDKDGWNKAIAIDKVLRGDPEFQGLSFKERFEKVAERYELVYGKPPVENEKSSEEKSKEAVKLALEKANEREKLPASISDIGGGSMPAVNEDLATADLSAVALAAKFEKMTPAQQDAYLSRVIT
jgi:hypothetical protein